MSVLFSYAFRPMFLLVCLFALISVPYWVLVWSGVAPLPLSGVNPVSWHAHEMLFGMVAAAIGGFSLTAVASWTNRPAVHGAPLVALVTLWLAGRVLPYLSTDNGLLISAWFDVGYDLLLLTLMSREVIAGGSARNNKVLLLLALLALANGWFYWDMIQGNPAGLLPVYAGIWVVVLLLNVIGGRIIPAFTGNWLRRQAQVNNQPSSNLPPGFNNFDGMAVLLTVSYAVLFCLNIHNAVTALLALSAAMMQALRIVRWKPLQTLSEPLLWILHSGFFWIPIGLVLFALADLNLIPTSAGIHALTSGAITILILAVASRAALGHTNRPLNAAKPVVIGYYCLHLATVCRVIATVIPHTAFLHSAATLWVVGFALFAWVYLPVLILPARKD